MCYPGLPLMKSCDCDDMHWAEPGDVAETQSDAGARNTLISNSPIMLVVKHYNIYINLLAQ